jgi:hypothetical protein
MRPDLTGCTIVPFVMLVAVTQLKGRSEVAVQVPFAVKLMTLLVVTSVSSWRVGLMCSWESWMKMFSGESVVSSN